MRKPTACRQCRSARRKCVLSSPPALACRPCRDRLLQCSYATTKDNDRQSILRAALPREDSISRLPANTSPAHRLEAPSAPPLPADEMYAPRLPGSLVEPLVEVYLRRIHDRPHSLFHPHSLLETVRQGTCSRALVLAICSMACWISDNPNLRDVHETLAFEAKTLLKADLENITLENIQTSCIIANLCEWSCNRTSEALFFRIAIGMAEIMNLSTPDLSSPIAERETKRRVFWTLFAADRWFSSGLHLGRLLDDFQKNVELPMDESMFHVLDPADMVLSKTWKPGLWAHMVGLHKLFGPILDLNHRCASEGILDNEREVLVADIANRLASWETMLPAGDRITEENLHLHRQRGTGGTLIALHLAHNYYSLLLYFQYLSHDHPLSSSQQTYMKRCKEHAEMYSRLVKLSREHSGCDALFPTVSHMTVVSSSVLLHTLLFGDQEEVANARATLHSNFEALVDFRLYWPGLTAQMIDRLTSFQEMCLLASSKNQHTHDFDKWMLRFVVEFALPLNKRTFTLKRARELGGRVDAEHMAWFVEQRRLIDFDSFSFEV